MSRVDRLRRRAPDELTRSQQQQLQANGAAAAAAALSPPSSPPTASSSSISSSAWARIASDRPHVEPPPSAPAATTTRIQFRWSGGRQVHRFGVDEHVRRVYEWLKAAPPDPSWSVGLEFELIFLGRNLIADLDRSIAEAGLMNGTVMVEFRGDGDDEWKKSKSGLTALPAGFVWGRRWGRRRG